MKTAISSDGVKHSFPDDTPRAVIDAAMKKYASDLPDEPVDNKRELTGAAKTAALDALLKGGRPLRNLGEDLTALAAGAGQGVGNMALTGQRLLGLGLSRVGADNVGRRMVSDADAGIKRLETEVAPYKARNPNVVIAGNIASSLPVGGLAGRGIAAGAKALGVGSKVAPLVAALESGGFRTGMIPRGAALVGSGAPSLGARAADYSLRAGAGALTGAAGSAAVNPDEAGTGAAIGAAIPVVGGVVGSVAGRTYKTLFPGAEKTASEIMKKSLGPDYDRAMDVLKNAPDNITARQALHDAGIDADPFMALGAGVEGGPGGPVFRKIREAQDQIRNSILERASGGKTATDAETAAIAAKKNLTTATTPLRENALARANIGNEIIPPLESEASALRAAAEKQTGIARRFGPKAEQLANDREILGGIDEVTQENLNKASGLAGLAENRVMQSAEESLRAGLAARTAEQKIASIKAAGVNKLDVSNVTTRMRKMATGVGTSTAEGVALTKAAKELETRAARTGGLIDARDVYEVRKTSLGDAVQKALEGTDPGQIQKRVASTLSRIQPMLDEAIEAAGGKGWNQYLKTYGSGIKEIERQDFAALAQRIYKESPEKYAKLIRGELPEEVEKIFGKGNFDIQKLVGSKYGPSRMPALEDVAGEIERDVRIGQLSSSGQQIAADLVKGGSSTGAKIARSAARIAAPRASYTADLVKALVEQDVSANTRKLLVEAFKSGKNAAELMSRVPAKEKAAAQKALASSFKNRASLAAALGVFSNRGQTQ